ncbi:MAG: thioredoxin [Muribaculaceae bacterium]|nr:thioredoxin [Muribaculaceae bacterium]
MAQTFTDENIKDIIASGKPVVVDFWATWCGPCKALAPAVDKIAEEYEGKVIVGKYNIDDETDFASECRVRSIPTLLFFKDGKQTDIRSVGLVSEDLLRTRVEELLAL